MPTGTTPKEFFKRANAFGHDEVELTNGEEIITYFTVSDIDEARDLMSTASKEQKDQRSRTFFNQPIQRRRRLGQGVHDRVESYCFAAGTFDTDDRMGLNRHLPLRVKAVSVREKTIAANEVWDLSVRGEQWGLDDREELYVILNIGTLTIEPGASLIIRGNLFFLLCQELIHEGNKTEKNEHFQIGILPTPFSVDSKSCLLYTSPSPRDQRGSRMPSSA